MKIAIKIVVCVLILAGIGLGTLAYMNKPISKEIVNEKIEKHLADIVTQHDSLSSALLTIYSKQTGYFAQFAVGTKNHTTDQPVQIDSPYHAASIGKTMCAAIFGMLVQEGRISYDDKITLWLDESLLDGLFVVDGVNYADQVTIRQLLSHTSGIGDYFEGPVTSGQPMIDLITSNPNRSFKPQQLLAFTRDYQQSVGKPGQQFYYSDTGYILLGLILEALEQKPYADILQDKIFKPLGMKNSYFMSNYDQPANILGIYVHGIDLSDKRALSVDWAGGGVVTTMSDLLTFMRALEERTLLSDEVYKQMTAFTHHYEKGITYGMGMMYFDFSELSFLLGSMSDLYGGVGSTGTYALYDKAKDTYFIANFGSLDFTQKGLEQLINIRMIYDRMIIE
ncbi:serine hydrolase domain-containing protein [Paenibacillus taiwanensis]|uniref:serine hydrolase domain-containing protein n=1 Tax=Paenibacillus taiwanensis TaxID=401638 RepID=UPI00041388C4|nr:serine hydrolase domain-containing protein [Paenibacillus taiwanensis]